MVRDPLRKCLSSTVQQENRASVCAMKNTPPDGRNKQRATRIVVQKTTAF